MTTSVSALIQTALNDLQSGKFEKATRSLGEVLTRNPKSFDALHFMGLAYAMQGRSADAVSYFLQALPLDGSHYFLRANLAKALSESGRLAEALPHYQMATELSPENPDAWLGYGHCLSEQGQTALALTIYEQALARHPANPAIWNNKGLTLIKLQQYAEALVALDKAISLSPRFAEAHYNQGIALDALERHAEALKSFDCALELRPDYASAWNNKGTVLLTIDRTLESLECFKQALKRDSHYPAALHNMGSAFRAMGQYEDAKSCYEHAIAIDPLHADAQLALSQLHLIRGEFSLGWEKFEFRWLSREDPPHRVKTQKPAWAGNSSGQPLLLWGEQGIGDQILYASILPELTELPQKTYVALDKRLLPLFARSMPGFEFVDLATVSDALGFAEQLPLGSLPRLFRPDLASFNNARHPYLQADADRSAELRQKIVRENQLVCGVSWSSKRQKLGPYKSLSLEQMLLPLASSRLHFVDLQYGDTVAERQALQEAHGVEVQHLDEVDNFHDIDGLAALIQACDVVITTSNSTAHLAGALGKPTLLLLPSGKGQLWYWAEINGTIPWYPSIQVFRQHETGNWQKPLQEIKAALETR